jgi:hypothetical protein
MHLQIWKLLPNCTPLAMYPFTLYPSFLVANRGLEASGLLLWDIVLMTGPRGISTAWFVEVIQLWTDTYIAWASTAQASNPQMTFVLCPWKQWMWALNLQRSDPLTPCHHQVAIMCQGYSWFRICSWQSQREPDGQKFSPKPTVTIHFQLLEIMCGLWTDCLVFAVSPFATINSGVREKVVYK